MLSLYNGPIRLCAALHLPHGEPCPAILIAHGYGGNKIGYRRRYIHLARRLAASGIATLRLDQRGCGESEGLFSSLTLEGLVSDLIVGLKFLKQHPAISKIGLLGSSLGGVLGIRVAQQFPIDALALWAVGADGKRWREEWQGTQEELADHFRCGEEAPPEQLIRECGALQSDSELAALTELPVFSAHGERDTLVLPLHQEAYQKVRANHPFDRFLRFPNSDHRFSHEGERAKLIEETVDWFQKTLV